MDESIITNPGDIILIKIGKEKLQGFYARVNNISADHKPGWWKIKITPFVPTKDFKLVEMEWKLDNDQIRGQEFTMNGGIPHQLFKVKFLEDEIIEPKKMFENKVINHIDKNSENPNDLSNLELVDADASVPIPNPKNVILNPTTNKESYLELAIDNLNPVRDPLKTYKKPDFTLVK